MKSKFLSAILILVLAFSLAVSVFAAEDTGQYISEAKAKTIALEHAGISATQAAFVKIELDYDDGRVIYEVEFYSGNIEYDYEIDAVNGTILEYDRDIEYYSPPSSSGNTNQYIGEAKAKSIALEHAGLSEQQAVFIKANLDHDDGHVVYDVEFYSENTEYDYEIDAVNGTVLEYDRDIEYYSPSSDLPSSWAASQVDTAIAANLVPAPLQSKYTQAITRAEFAALAVTLYETAMKKEIATDKSIVFTDTMDVNIYKAAAIGVVNGTNTEQTIFNPDTQLTREQAAAMLSRLAAAMDSPLTGHGQGADFIDSASVSDWAVGAVRQVRAAGIMNGIDGNKFDPQGIYTREQSIVTIMRLYDVVK